MAYANSTQHPKQFGLDEPAVWPEGGTFFVTTIKEVLTAKAGKMPRGAHVLIDPAIAPMDSDTVLVADRLEPWKMQPGVRGVATQWHQHFR